MSRVCLSCRLTPVSSVVLATPTHLPTMSWANSETKIKSVVAIYLMANFMHIYYISNGNPSRAGDNVEQMPPSLNDPADFTDFATNLGARHKRVTRERHSN